MKDIVFLSEQNPHISIKDFELINYLIETHENCIFFVDAETLSILCVNQAACVFLETDKTRILNKNIFDILPFQINNDIKDNIKNCLKNNIKSDVNVSFETEVFNLKFSPFSGGILLSIRKLAQKVDNVDEKNFKLLFENMSSGFIYLKVNFDENGDVINNQIVDINSMFEIFFTVDRNNVIGKSIETVLPQIDSRVFSAINLTAKTGRSRSCNFDYKPNKKYFQVCTYSPRQGYSAVIFNDLKAEIEIRNDLKVKSKISKAFALGYDTNLYRIVLELLLETTKSKHGYIGYLDEEGGIECLARRDDALTLEKNSTNEDRIVIIPEYVTAKSLQTKNQEMGVNVLGHKTLLATPVFDKENNIIGVIGVADSPKGYDLRARNTVQELADYIAPLMLSEIKEREYKRNLVIAKEKAEAGEKLKSNFLGNISHEIRTPAHIIIGNCELLMRQAADNLSKVHQQALNDILLHTQKMVYIVDAIKNLAKIESGQVQCIRIKTNLNSLVDTIKRKWEFEAQHKRLYINVEKGLEGEDAIVMTDSPKLKSILEALVTNGIRFTNLGGVTIKYVLDNDNVIFSVSDTGIGIKPEKHNAIFDPFEQCGSEEEFMRENSGGVGLGLTISKGFANAMGGQIWLESEPQKGSTFYLKIKYEKFKLQG